jgi:sugar lactone lactonase YvrE
MSQGQKKAELFLDLPEYCNTPDGMTLGEDGNIYLSCPNFNNPLFPGLVMKISPRNELSIFYAMPAHPETKMACPMGLDFGPDGNLYIADNQYFYNTDHKSRLVRIVFEDGKPVKSEIVAEGMNLANAVIWKGNDCFVSETRLNLSEEDGSSGIYRFTLDEMNRGTVKLKPGKEDSHLIAGFKTAFTNRGDLAGADGMTIDSEGNLYTGNFGNGVMSKISFNEDGTVKSNEIFVQDKTMTCVDGIFYDAARDVIYVADSEKNAIRTVSMDGKVGTLSENADTDGSDGGMDQPCEVLVRGDEMIIANFDMPFSGLKNSKFDAPYTLSVIKLK